MMTSLHEQHQRKRFVQIYCDTDLNKADMNTNAYEGGILQEKNLKFYPPKGSVHDELLELAK